jgi:hypothetical protein
MHEKLTKLLIALQTATIQIENTWKNRETRYRLGLTIDDQKEIVRSLVLLDYTSGPEGDHNIPSGVEIWKFKKLVSGTLFYIKVRWYEPSGDADSMDAISCHIDNI